MAKEVSLIPRLNQEDFDSQTLIRHKDKTVVIFSADWCPYCISFFNNWSEYGNVEDIYIADITDVESELWDSFDIKVVPTLFVFKDGISVKRWDGLLQVGLTINQIESVNNFYSNL